MTAGLVVFDLLLVVFAVVFYTGAGLVAERVYRPLAAIVPWPVAAVVASIVFLVVLVLEVSVASRLTPRPRPGRYAAHRLFRRYNPRHVPTSPSSRSP